MIRTGRDLGRLISRLPSFNLDKSHSLEILRFQRIRASPVPASLPDSVPPQRLQRQKQESLFALHSNLSGIRKRNLLYARPHQM
jgi:hypothetical protein